jgi:Flp pilus assembly protein TadD
LDGDPRSSRASLRALRLVALLASIEEGALIVEGGGDEAIAHLKEALRLKPDLTSAHVNLAMLLVKSGDVPEARRHLETALQIDPGNGAARQLLDRLR